MTSSERLSPEPLLKKEACPAVLRGENSGNALELSNTLSYRFWRFPAILSGEFQQLWEHFWGDPKSFRKFSGMPTLTCHPRSFQTKFMFLGLGMFRASGRIRHFQATELSIFRQRTWSFSSISDIFRQNHGHFFLHNLVWFSMVLFGASKPKTHQHWLSEELPLQNDTIWQQRLWNYFVFLWDNSGTLILDYCFENHVCFGQAEFPQRDNLEENRTWQAHVNSDLKMAFVTARMHCLLLLAAMSFAKFHIHESSLSTARTSEGLVSQTSHKNQELNFFGRIFEVSGFSGVCSGRPFFRVLLHAWGRLMLGSILRGWRCLQGTRYRQNCEVRQHCFTPARNKALLRTSDSLPEDWGFWKATGCTECACRESNFPSSQYVSSNSGRGTLVIIPDDHLRIHACMLCASLSKDDFIIFGVPQMGV